MSDEHRPTDSLANAAWLQEHGAAHEGNWVALRNGELVAEHKSRRALTRLLREDGGLEGVTLVPLFDVLPLPPSPLLAAEGHEADLIAEGRRLEREAVVELLKRERADVRDSRGYFDNSGAWDPEDDEAAELDRIISRWIERVERGDHLKAGDAPSLGGKR